MTPQIHTARLTLRPHRLSDFGAYAAMLADPDHARFMGGGIDRSTAWDWFCVDIAQWPLMGFGPLAIEVDGEQPAYVGHVAVTQPPRFPEPELGWSLFKDQQGRGYATEAAEAMRHWSFADRGLETLVSYIHPDNAASIRVAERLGAQVDPSAAGPAGDPVVVYRYARGDA